MRRALAVLAVVGLVVVGAWAYLRAPDAVGTPSPSPAATTTAASASPTRGETPSASVSPSPAPTASSTGFGPPLTTGGVTIRAAAAQPGSDFRYVTTRESTATMHWVVLLDLVQRRAHYVAEVEIHIPAGSQAAPAIAVSPSADGRTVLLAATEPAGLTQLFSIAVGSGQVRHVRELDQFSTVALSGDGSRFAYTDVSQNAARHGLWIEALAGGASDRVVASSPLRSGGPARPIAFSPDGTQIAAVVTFGPGDNGIAIVATRGAEARVNDQGRTVEGAILLERGSDFDWAGAPPDAWTWEGRDAFGGSNAVHSYDLATGRRTLVYEPVAGQGLRAVDRHPALDRFATQEHEGLATAGAIWVRTRQGGATKVADVQEGGPHSPWWSQDGSRLYALISADDSVGSVTDLLTGEAILTYCTRNAGPECV